MNPTNRSLARKDRVIRCITVLALGLASLALKLPHGELQADPGYTARSGRIAFAVGTNIPFLKVSGSSSAVKGGGEATVAGNTATIRNLRFEVDPKTFKTGMELRDRHMYEKVFTAADGSIPRLVLRAGQFQAHYNPKTSKWEGSLQAQLTLRGVTKPVLFRASGEKKGAGGIINAAGTVKTSDFGVNKISYTGATVNDDVVVTVSDLRIEP